MPKSKALRVQWVSTSYKSLLVHVLSANLGKRMFKLHRNLHRSTAWSGCTTLAAHFLGHRLKEVTCYEKHQVPLHGCMHLKMLGSVRGCLVSLLWLLIVCGLIWMFVCQHPAEAFTLQGVACTVAV